MYFVFCSANPQGPHSQVADREREPISLENPQLVFGLLRFIFKRCVLVCTMCVFSYLSLHFGLRMLRRAQVFRHEFIMEQLCDFMLGLLSSVRSHLHMWRVACVCGLHIIIGADICYTYTPSPLPCCLPSNSLK